jgi:hypothetical protein
MCRNDPTLGDKMSHLQNGKSILLLSNSKSFPYQPVESFPKNFYVMSLVDKNAREKELFEISENGKIKK